MSKLAYVLNLPSEITSNILLRLPIRAIVSCKCVCTKWRKLISSLEFSKSHLSISTPGLIVYMTQNDESLWRIFEFEDVLEIRHYELRYKLLMKFDPNLLSSSPDTNITILCSVNGLLCLYAKISELDTLYICNPLLREYFSLPGLKGDSGVEIFPSIITYGIGISPSSGQYKVVRIFHKQITGVRTVSNVGNLRIECMVYTLGTGSWRSIEHSQPPYEYDLRPSVGAFLNGNLHWLVGDVKGSQLISCFDLETESFKPFPPPFAIEFPGGASLSVLGDCLCYCDYSSDDEIVIWTMKEYGVKESWTKEYVIDKDPHLGGLSYESVHALKVFKDGDILMLWENNCLFYYRSTNDTVETEIDLFERDRYSWLDAILHTPSLISLGSYIQETVSSF